MIELLNYSASFLRQPTRTDEGATLFFLLFSFFLLFFSFLFFLRSSVTFSQSLARCSVNASRKTTDLHDTHRYIEIKRGGLIGGKNVDKKMAVSRHVN